MFVLCKGYVAQPAGFRAGYPQIAVTRLDNAGGLGKPCILGGTVLQPFNPGTRENTDGFRDGVVAEELVGASHRDHELPGFTRVDRIPRGRERYSGGGRIRGDMVCVARDGVVSINNALHAVARKGTNLARAQIQRAQSVIHGVGNQHIVPKFFAEFGGYQGKPLRFVKACGGPGSVGVAFFAVLSPAVGCQHRVEVFGNLQDAVPSGIGHQVGA